MSEREGMADADRRREIPSVHAVVEAVAGAREGAGAGAGASPDEALITKAAQEVIEEHREAIRRHGAPGLSAEQLAARARERVDRMRAPPLRWAINATGILLHTGLGRAPMAPEAVEAMAEVAGRYAPVELDLESGGRGHRHEIVEPLLCRLTGAEAAAVVNNAAAAVMLVVAALASGRSVIVSRGELIEIGGSFRLPEVLEAGGARLREVGTTNKTRLDDYERAIDDETALLMKAHPSNYRIEGFTASVSVGDLARLGARIGVPGVPVVHDIGSGVLTPAHAAGLAGAEPIAGESVRDGAGLVIFSGDKLLGGPQCGLIVGRRELVDRVRRHPMMRALRVDKLTLAGLGATLALHLEPERARRSIPALAAMEEPIEWVRARAERVAAGLSGLPGLARARVIETEAYAGGGTAPKDAIPSFGVQVTPIGGAESRLAEALRMGKPPVIARVHEGAVVLDMRSVPTDQTESLSEAVRAAVECIA